MRRMMVGTLRRVSKLPNLSGTVPPWTGVSGGTQRAARCVGQVSVAQLVVRGGDDATQLADVADAAVQTRRNGRAVASVELQLTAAVEAGLWPFPLLAAWRMSGSRALETRVGVLLGDPRRDLTVASACRDKGVESHGEDADMS